jgi:dephospho-CoA kinase
VSRPQTETDPSPSLLHGRVPLIALTGGMGAGKSTALAALERLGAEVLSSDAVVHELYEGETMRAAVVERWGEDVIAPNGTTVDRAKVAERAFANAQERRWLEQTLWPLVGERIAQWIAQVQAREPVPRAAVIEVPLLFEAGMEGMYDATIAVIADENVRRERAAARGHALEDARVGRQLSQEEKAKRATFVVHNDGDVGELTAQLSGVLEKLRG